jgi:hypothetical protein
MLQMTPARSTHCFAIAKHLRPIDREEGVRMGHLTALDQVISAYQHSAGVARTCLDGGVPISMAGVVRLDEQCGSAWMLSVPLSGVHKRFLLREAPRFIEAAHFVFPTLVVAVAPENRESIRFLRWLGFDTPAKAPFELPPGLDLMVKSIV